MVVANKSFRAQLFLASLFACVAWSTAALPLDPTWLYWPDRLLVQPRQGQAVQLAALHQQFNARVINVFENINGIQVVALPRGSDVPAMARAYEDSQLVNYAEPDYIRHLDSTLPNDPKFGDGTLWGLNNYGQNSGTPDADIDAPEAWDISRSASNIIVAIIDTGMRYTHEDLAANVWTNPADGAHGTNAIYGSDDPADDNRHGSLMAGVIGAVGNNAIGVVGVAWQVQMMACKAFSSNGVTSDSVLAASVDYARVHGARIISGSFDSTAFGQSLSNAIYNAKLAGIIFVASAGNDGANIDLVPRYPACYAIDNIVSVAYTTRTDQLGMFSNYGQTNVDLAAPGDQIYSTSYTSDSAYYPPTGLGINVSGTSYAAAYVSGALALMLNKYPSESYQQIIARLLRATDPLPALLGKCGTGGRLNLRYALSPPIRLVPLGFAPNGSFQIQVNCDTNRTVVIQKATDLSNWQSVYTNTTSVSGEFEYSDLQATNSSPRFYRATAQP